MRHFINFRISGLFLCLLAMGSMDYAHAQQVDSRTALDIAANYLAQERGNRAPVRGNELEIAYAAQEASETYYYAINYGTDDGFVIVSGHEDVQEVLGYAEEGHFDYDSIAPGLRYMLGSYQEQIHALYTDPALANEHRAGRRNATAARSNIANFVGITWNQYAPYNFGITGGKNSYPIGCVNTATSIVMKYYNHPAQATNPAMESYSLGSVTARAVEANRTLNFSAMTNSYSSSTTSYSGANKAVADLMYLVARLNDTDFDIDGSGAWEYTSAENMLDYLDYDKTMEYVERDKFSSTDWDNMMYAEMSAKRPVIYTGRDADRNVGHAFLLTGYKDSKYYINWGWGGSSNGYFALSACNVNNRKYNQAQTAITHIKKDAGGNPSISISSYSVENTDLRLGKTFCTKINYQANTIKRSIYSWQVKLKNVNTGAITAMHIAENYTMKGATYLADLSKYSSLWDTIPTTFVPGDQYEVLLYYKQGNGSWKEVAQSTKPVITIKHQIDFKSYALNNTDLSYGSKPNLVVTYNKYSIASSIGYDLCAKVTNMTQGTDTLELLKSDYKPSNNSKDQTVSLQMLISGLYHIGDKVKIEAGYRISGTEAWTYINQTPITVTLGNELDVKGCEIALSGEQLPSTTIPYKLTYTCRTTKCQKIDLAVRYQGIDNSLDSTVLLTSNYSPSEGADKTTTYSYGKLSSILAMNKSYKLTGYWRWNGETQWREYPSSTTAQVTILPAMTFTSFEMNKTELASGDRDTITFHYSSVKCSSTQYYKLGLHVLGLTSKVDTVVTIKSNFNSSAGEDLTSKVAFNVPGFLWLGEEVKLTGCYQEPNGPWTDIAQAPAQFRVTDCYRFESCNANSDSIYIGSTTSFVLKYASLHASSKPDYQIGLKLHNQTRTMPDTIIVLTKSFSDSKKTDEGSKTYSAKFPTTFEDGDMIQSILVYQPSGMPEWYEGSSKQYRGVSIYYRGYNIPDTDVSRGTYMSIEYSYYKPSNTISVPYDLGVKLTNQTQQRDTMIVVKEKQTPSNYYTTTSGSCLIPATFAVGDKCQAEPCFRKTGTSTWEYINQEPTELTLAPEMEIHSSSVNDSGDLTFGYNLHYKVGYIRRSSLSQPYELGMSYKGIDNPLDTVYCFNTSFAGSVGGTSTSSTTGLPSFLKLNKSYRLEVKYRVKGESNWQDFDDATTADIRVIPAVTFHSFDHPSTEKFACAYDTLSFVYSKVSSSNSLSYKIGAHLIGQSSGVDTTVVTTVNKYYSTFSGSTGDQQTTNVTFYLPSTLRVGEQVKVQLCWQEPGEAWIPMVNEYKTFKVLDCYELQKCWADADTAHIGESCTIKVDYRALTTSSKPTYYLGVRLHNKTTGVTEEVIETSYSLSSSASTTETSTKEVSFMMPSNYHLEDQVEVTAMYRVGQDGEWMQVPGQPVVLTMKAPKAGFSLVGKPSAANDGYITPKNFEIHLQFRNYQKQELRPYIDLDIHYNGSYQSSYVRKYITLAPDTITEVVLTAENCSTISLSRLTSGRDYTFRVYTSTGYISKVSDSPILHLLAYGDVTMDGNNDGDDIEAMKQHLLDPIAHPFGIASQVAADMNVDGKVTIGDMTLIIKSQQVQQ